MLNSTQLLELERGAGRFTQCTKDKYVVTLNKNLTLKGLGEEGATIDCGGSGGGIQVGPAALSELNPMAVSIEGFHLRNMNGTLAGGVEASNVSGLSIMWSTFENCYGLQAGAILVQGMSGFKYCHTYCWNVCIV